LTKEKVLEVILRGHIVEQNILPKIGEGIKAGNLKVDFTSTVAVPPYKKSYSKRFESTAVLYATTDLEDRFKFDQILKSVAESETIQILSIREM
jgi:hypothetical protein